MIQRTGDVGRKLHTGRSRNDQVGTDLKLYVRDAIDQLDSAAVFNSSLCYEKAEKYEKAAIGYERLAKVNYRGTTSAILASSSYRKAGNLEKAKAISHSYAASGSYVVKLAITNDYCPKYEQFLQGDSVKVVLPVSPSIFTLFVLADIDTVLSPLRKDPGYTQFAWNPSTYLSNSLIEHPLFRSTKSINYTLTRTEVLTACKVEDIYKMDVSDLVVVSIPKAFTPNNDNLNDILKIEYGAGLKVFHFLKIFNRWGNVVFQTTNLNQGWDGNVNGNPQEMDAYTYFISYVTYKDEPVSKTGSFILLR